MVQVFLQIPSISNWKKVNRSAFVGCHLRPDEGFLPISGANITPFPLNGSSCKGLFVSIVVGFVGPTQRLQQHLAYIPKKLGYNPCFQALQSQGRTVDYEAVRMPQHVLGLARREFLPTCGPQIEQTTLLAKQRQKWQAELDACQDQLKVIDEPDDAQERGAQIGDALTALTQQWFQLHYPLGASPEAQQQLIDGWIQILCIDFGENNPDWDNWLAFVFLAWGDHWLPDIIAELLDGEAEKVVDELYAQFATELPRYHTLARIAFLGK